MHMRISARRAAALALFVPLAACGGRGGDMDLPGPSTTPLADAAATITADDMIERIGVLAHDSMRGRDTPSPGLESAARYIVREFRRMGLEGGAEGGEFIQRYPFPLIGLDTLNVSLAISGMPALTYGDHYLVYAGSESSIDAPLAVVGPAAAFAESAPAAGSLAGKVTVAALAGPYGRDMAIAMDRARSAAESAGALATIFVLPADFTAETYAQFRARLGSPRRTLGGLTNRPMVLVRHDIGARLMDATGAATVALRAPTSRERDDTAPNVIAILRGGDPALADEYVVFSAHMDHVGVGRPDADGDSIYNGADDNASGTAALLALAEHFARNPARHSLLFVALDAEEQGLRGARAFVAAPPVPKEAIVLNVNMDMVSLSAKGELYAAGAAKYPELREPLQRVAARAPVRLLLGHDTPVPTAQDDWTMQSDQGAFHEAGIPFVYFGVEDHPHYHKPSDELRNVTQSFFVRAVETVRDAIRELDAR